MSTRTSNRESPSPPAGHGSQQHTSDTGITVRPVILSKPPPKHGLAEPTRLLADALRVLSAQLEKSGSRQTTKTYVLTSTIENVVSTLKKAIEKLDQEASKITSATKETSAKSPHDERVTQLNINDLSMTITAKLDEMTKTITETHQAICKLTETTNDTNQEVAKATRTWAQVAADAKAGPNSSLEKIQQRKQEQRMEWANTQITLTLSQANQEVRAQIAEEPHAKITETLQQAIRDSELGDEAPTIQGIRKLKSNDIRSTCATPEAAAKLRQNVDWNWAYSGLSTTKPKYGIVVHGVPTKDFDPTNEESRATVEKQNAKDGMRIVGIHSLRRKPGKETRPHQSIVIFMDDVKAANQSIAHGIYINYGHYMAEKYTPHLKVLQCYNCQKFGHVASKCKATERCGMCGGPHKADQCNKSNMKCANCDSNHSAWHLECPKRNEETKTVAEAKHKTSPYFDE